MIDTRKRTAKPVLVVDDDPSLCDLVGQVLENEGYEPVICTHPRDALAVCEKETFGLVFIDLNLPDMGGLELASTLKLQTPLLAVVYISGYGTWTMRSRPSK